MVVEEGGREATGIYGLPGGLGQATACSFSFLFHFSFSFFLNIYCFKLLFKVFLKLLRRRLASCLSRLSVRQ